MTIVTLLDCFRDLGHSVIATPLCPRVYVLSARTDGPISLVRLENDCLRLGVAEIRSIIRDVLSDPGDLFHDANAATSRLLSEINSRFGFEAALCSPESLAMLHEAEFLVGDVLCQWHDRGQVDKIEAYFDLVS